MTSVNIQSIFGGSSYSKEQQKQFVGSEHHFAPNTTNMGLGWLEKSGQLVSRTTYAVLWEWVQATQGSQLVTDTDWTTLQTGSYNNAVSVYSSGDGSTTFRLPSMGDGGFNKATGTTTDPVLLNVGFQDQIVNITGTIYGIPRASGSFTADGVFEYNPASGTASASGSESSVANILLDASSQVRTGAEVQPKGQYVKVFIYTGADTTTYSTTETFNGIIDSVVSSNTVVVSKQDQSAALDNTTASFTTELDDKLTGVEEGAQQRINPNILRNGDFRINQRGSGAGDTLAYGEESVDGWAKASNGLKSTSQVDTNGHLRLALSPNNTTDNYLSLRQRIEASNFNIVVDEGTDLCLSGLFWLSSDAANKMDKGFMTVAKPTSEIADDWSGGFTNIYSDSTDLVAGWNSFSITNSFTKEEIAQGLQVNLGFYNSAGDGVGTVGNVIANLKLERSSYPTAFYPEEPSVALQRCKRFYELVTSGSGGYTDGTVSQQMWFTYEVEKVKTPSVVWVSNTEEFNAGTLSVNNKSTRGHKVYFSPENAGTYVLTSTYEIEATL